MKRLYFVQIEFGTLSEHGLTDIEERRLIVENYKLEIYKNQYFLFKDLDFADPLVQGSFLGCSFVISFPVVLNSYTET